MAGWREKERKGWGLKGGYIECSDRGGREVGDRDGAQEGWDNKATRNRWRKMKKGKCGGKGRKGGKGRIYSALLHLQLALVALIGREKLYRHFSYITLNGR